MILDQKEGQGRRSPTKRKAQVISDIFIYAFDIVIFMVKQSNYTVIIEQDEDGIYLAKVPDIPGCYTQGKSVEQAIERVKEAIQVCLEAENAELYEPLRFIGLQQVEVYVA